MNIWDKFWSLFSNKANSDNYSLLDVYDDEDDAEGLEMVAEKRPSSTIPKNFICFISIVLLTILVFLILSIAIESDNYLGNWKSIKKQDISMYVHPETKTTLIDPEHVCEKHGGNKLLVLILVCSTVDNFERRQLIRETWGSFENYIETERIMNNVKEYNRNLYNLTDDVKLSNETKFNLSKSFEYNTAILNDSASKDKIITMKEINAKTVDINNTDFKLLFFIGFPNITDVKNNGVQKRIETEAKQFNDIVQEGFVDAHTSVTLKSVMMLKWVLMSCRENVRYIFKVEEDTFVNVHNLVKNLRCRANKHDCSKNRESKEYLLIGHLHSVRKPKSYLRHPLTKLFSHNEPHQHSSPTFLTAPAGYVMSMPAVSAIYLAAQSTPYVSSEDVFITGHCAWRSIPRVTPHHDYRFSNLKISNATDPCAWYDLVTAGHGDCTVIRRMHEQMLDSKSVLRCKNRHHSRKH